MGWGYQGGDGMALEGCPEMLGSVLQRSSGACDKSLVSSLRGGVPALKLGSGKNCCCCCFPCALALFLCPWLVPKPSVLVKRPGIFLAL